MKQIINYLILSFTFLGCTQKTTAQNSNMEMNENLWKPISLKNWKQTPAINDRNANEEDVKNGIAVYYIEGNFDEHKPYKIQLPKLAYLTDFETKEKELVVIIQIEKTPKGIVVGYRNLTGGNGAGLMNEFEILSDNNSEKLTK